MDEYQADLNALLNQTVFLYPEDAKDMISALYTAVGEGRIDGSEFPSFVEHNPTCLIGELVYALPAEKTEEDGESSLFDSFKEDFFKSGHKIHEFRPIESYALYLRPLYTYDDSEEEISDEDHIFLQKKREQTEEKLMTLEQWIEDWGKDHPDYNPRKESVSVI